MLLMFPDIGNFSKQKNETRVVKSLNKENFHKEIDSLQLDGWEVQEMSTNFRRTLFGGVISYKAELEYVGKKEANFPPST